MLAIRNRQTDLHPGNRRDDHDDTDELSLERVIGELACDVARADG